MNLNPGLAILPNRDGVSTVVNFSGHVWGKDYANSEDALVDAVKARLLTQEDASSILEGGRGFVGSPLQYYPSALRACGFREYPAEDARSSPSTVSA